MKIIFPMGIKYSSTGWWCEDALAGKYFWRELFRELAPFVLTPENA